MKKIIVSGALALLLSGVALNAKTLAVVDGVNITEQDVGALLKAMPGVNYDALPEEQKKRVLDQVIERELLTKLAKKEGIDKDKEYIETLAKIKDDLALEVWMKKEFEKIKVGDKESKKYYDENKQAFLQEETRRARHILVKTEEEAKEIIKEISKDPKTVAETFVKIADEKTQDPSGKGKGGDLGYFGKKQMVPEFSNAAFGLKKGEITKEPVKTQFGYHIVYLDDVKPESTVSFEDAKAKIVQNLKMNKFKDAMQDRAKKLREKAKIEIK